MHSVPFPSPGMAGAVDLLILYRIDIQFIKLNNNNQSVPVPVVPVKFLEFHISPLYIITTYILISYIIFNKGVHSSFFNWNDLELERTRS